LPGTDEATLMTALHASIDAYNGALGVAEKKICRKLMRTIDQALPDAERKVWHGHPVWFLDGNPIVGYSRLKDCIRLMFWSGADFDEPGLLPGSGKFRDASARYTDAAQIDAQDLGRWLEKARNIQWDYKNVVKRKGKLLRLETGRATPE
jgi:hypothetical protein